MVILDCSMSGFARLKNMNLENVSKIYVLVTHTHGDHISGIGLLIDYEYIVGKIPVVVVAPNEEVRNDLEFYLTRMEGISEDWYSLVSSTELEVSWLRAAIPTTHVPTLAGRCFGYALRIDGRDVVYTGDTNTLPSLAGFFRNVDLLLADGLFPAADWAEGKPHLSAELAASLAAEAGAEALVITHLNPVYPPEILLQEARPKYPGVLLASAGQVLPV